MADLIEFLTDRLDEDEAVAQTATNGDGQWLWTHDHGNMCSDPDCSTGQLVDRKDNVDAVLMDVHAYDIRAGWQGATHIARWDPARVFAEIQAKRHIIELWRSANKWRSMSQITYRRSQEQETEEIVAAETLDAILCLLALPYDTHPDYREEWRP